jgi:hypothetical protein
MSDQLKQKYFVIAYTGAWGMESPFILNATSKGDCWKQILTRYNIHYLFDLEDLICNDRNINPLTLKLHEKTVEWVFNFEDTPVYNTRYLKAVQNALDTFINRRPELCENKYEWSYSQFGDVYEDLLTLFAHLDNIYYRQFAVINISNRQEEYITHTFNHNIEYSGFENEFSFTMGDETTPSIEDDNDVYCESYKLSDVAVLS